MHLMGVEAVEAEASAALRKEDEKVSTAEMGHGKESSLQYVAGGSLVEAIGGLGAVILGIVGLAGVAPQLLASVAALAIGAALLAEGGSLASRYSDLAPDFTGPYGSQEVGTGVTAELVGGMAGVALGILAILGVEPLVLLAVAAIVFGAALLIGSTATARMNDLRQSASAGMSDRARQVAREAVSGATGAQVLVGLAAVALGILALVAGARETLILIAMLAVGGSILLTGSAVGARIMSLVRH
jgi:hypothetical protein